MKNRQSLNKRNRKKIKTNLPAKFQYEKPKLKKAKKMVFMFEPYKTSPLKITCRQCSGCHGCRGG